jgi:site-specific recombinase XerD
MIYGVKFNLPLLQQKFIRHLKRNNYSPETLVGYDKDLLKFGKYIFGVYDGSVLVEELGKDDLQDYLDFLREENYSLNTIARNISTLKSFFNYLVSELSFTENPAGKIKTPQPYTPLPEILTLNEIEHFLNTTKNYSKVHFVLLSSIYYTGSRLTPIRLLLKQNIYLDERRIYFPKIKGGRDLHLPIYPKLHDILDEYLYHHRHETDFVFPSNRFKNKPMSAADIRIHIKKVQKRAGINKRITPHIIRHCTATHLTVLGVDQRYISAILGHVDLRSTARYQHLNVDNLRDSLKKLK